MKKEETKVVQLDEDVVDVLQLCRQIGIDSNEFGPFNLECFINGMLIMSKSIMRKRFEEQGLSKQELAKIAKDNMKYEKISNIHIHDCKKIEVKNCPVNPYFLVTSDLYNVLRESAGVKKFFKRIFKMQYKLTLKDVERHLRISRNSHYKKIIKECKDKIFQN